jgi:hypothetical protein
MILSPSGREPHFSFLKRALEEGTYPLECDQVSRRIDEVLGKENWPADEEMTGLLLPLAAGLALYRPADHRDRFARLLSDGSVSRENKIKALQLIREHVSEPSRFAAGLDLYSLFLESPDSRLKDFAVRVFLQNLTEMRIGGQSEQLMRGENRVLAARLLKKLAAENWLEADELLDFLELADAGA